jgi:hypothetical protein
MGAVEAMATPVSSRDRNREWERGAEILRKEGKLSRAWTWRYCQRSTCWEPEQAGGRRGYVW